MIKLTYFKYKSYRIPIYIILYLQRKKGEKEKFDNLQLEVWPHCDLIALKTYIT